MTDPSPATPPRSPGDGVLDAQALARLHQLDPDGQAGLVARVIDTYARSLQRLIEQLGEARAAADAQSMRHVAHTLKSSSASVGALQLSALCADIERRMRDGVTEGLEAQLDALRTEGARVLHAVTPNRQPTP